MSEKEFVNGLIVKPPHEKAPDFVKCAIAINRHNLEEWLSTRTTEWINLDVKVGRSGKWYAEVNNWNKQKTQPKDAVPSDDFEDSDLPF